MRKAKPAALVPMKAVKPSRNPSISLPKPITAIAPRANNKVEQRSFVLQQNSDGLASASVDLASLVINWNLKSKPVR